MKKFLKSLVSVMIAFSLFCSAAISTYAVEDLEEMFSPEEVEEIDT